MCLREKKVDQREREREGGRREEGEGGRGRGRGREREGGGGGRCKQVRCVLAMYIAMVLAPSHHNYTM